MFKEQSTESLIKYIQTLPGEEQKLIIKRIAKTEKVTKKGKPAVRKGAKLSTLKGKIEKTTSVKINRQIKALHNTWQRDI